jgi:hypothetical protein
MNKTTTSWKKDVLARSSIRTAIALNATEKFAAAAEHVLISAANRTGEQALCYDNPAISEIASRFAFSAALKPIMNEL